ncbi:uncharacterized protein [Dysidea avara]|uniref:uncharacterized protein n=1 Tax=Dysidea avara TaxID=196820 RepID=UPI00332AB2A8
MAQSQGHCSLPSKKMPFDIQKPIVCGHLYKQNRKGGFFNKRYFALYQHYLVYYVHEADYKKDKESNTLQHRHGAYNLEGVFLGHCEKKPQGAKYCFIMHTPAPCNKRREVLLNCGSQSDRKIWMEKIQAQNAKLTSHHHDSSSGSDSSLTVPRGHQRQPSVGGEGDMNVQDGDSDEDSTQCQLE